jgi:hypothetical protein
MKSAFSIYCWPLLWLVIMSCQSTPTEHTTTDALEGSLQVAGRNRSEIEKVLAHYRQRPQDSLKYEAAVRLISGMSDRKHYSGQGLKDFDKVFSARHQKLPEDSLIALYRTQLQIHQVSESSEIVFDLTTLSAAYLIENIDLAFDAWQQAPWRSQVSFEAFCNFILPYKSFSEYPENWRKSFYERYKYVLKSEKNLMQASRMLTAELKGWFKYTAALDGYPGRLSVSNLLKAQHGNCNDMSNVAAYSCRSVGIPVAIDFTPQWANDLGGHVWNALILNDSVSVEFLGAENQPGEYSHFSRHDSKTAKVFRSMLNPQASSFAQQARVRGIKDIPANLASVRVSDVTSLYTCTQDITLNVTAPDGTPVYLGLFSGKTWSAIAGAFVKANRATFSAMGNNILYMPLFYDADGYRPAAKPFLLKVNNQVEVLPLNQQQTQTLTLRRKAPMKWNTAKWILSEYLHHCRLEGANQPDFSDAQVLYTLPEPIPNWGIWRNGGAAARDRLEYESLWEQNVLTPQKAFRYVRLMAQHEPDDPLKVGEIRLWAHGSSTPLRGKPIGSVAHPEWAFDGVPGRSIIEKAPNPNGQWVGLDLGQPTTLEKFAILPACDANQVEPGAEYELMYWDDGWVSLGKQRATTYEISFRDAPTGALFWLHKYGRSGNERPFTYENGKQLWW